MMMMTMLMMTEIPTAMATLYDDDATGDAIVDVVVLGERHSGVDWLMEELKGCYNYNNDEASAASSAVRVLFGWSRPGYWFQEEEEYFRDEVAGDDDDNEDDIVMRTNTLVVLNMVRDPYDWLREMWQHPLYMPAHQQKHQEGAAAATPLDLSEFVTKAWTVDEDEDDDHEATTSEKDDASCQFGFRPNQVVPCLNASTVDVLDKNTPVYELDPTTGLVFPNIMALRAAKLRHQLDEIPKLWHMDDNSDERRIHHVCRPLRNGADGRAFGGAAQADALVAPLSRHGTTTRQRNEGG